LPTLGAANAVAQPGDEVIVAEGIYREQLSIKTPRVVWRSESPGGAIIDGGWNGKTPGNNGNWVGVGGDGVRFEGFTIRNVPGRAIYIGGDNCLIENLRIDMTGTAGLIVGGATKTTVRGVVLTRASMEWEGGQKQSAAGSLMVIESTECVVEDCTVAYGYGEGINIGRGSRECVVRGCTIFDNAHLGLYFNRCVDSLGENNLIFLTGYEPRNVGAERWPAGIVFGDEGSEKMRNHPHGSGNVARGNVVVNCGVLVDVRNNAKNYNTQLDGQTVIQNNTLIAGPCTRFGFNIPANQHGRAHGEALIADNVIDMSQAADGAMAVNGGRGPRWTHNAWSVAPGDVARSASDVVGALGLVNPGAALSNEFPDPSHNLLLSSYRPRVGSPLIGAGIDGATMGALEPDGPTTEPPPPPPPVDWDALLEKAASAGARLAAIGEAGNKAREQLVEANQQMAIMSLAHEDAADELAALLTMLDEYRLG